MSEFIEGFRIEGFEGKKLINEQVFERHVRDCANTGNLIQLPKDLDEIECGNIIAKVAGELIDQKQDIKAIILLEERRRLGV